MPDSVKTGEEFQVTLVVTNNGGAGEFRSAVSYRYNDNEWETSDEELTQFVGAGATEQVGGDPTSFQYPGTYQFRIEETDTTSTIEVERPQEYDPEYARENARSPSYDSLFREFDTYEGEPIHFQFGSVYQVVYDWDEERSIDYLQLDVANNNDEYEGDIAALWGGDERILENDVIELWGVAERLYEYETVQGDYRTIPMLTLVDYEIEESG